MAIKAFISSVYLDSAVPGKEKHLSIRRRLWEFGQAQQNVTVWVAEYPIEAPQVSPGRPWYEIVGTCVHNLREADVYIGLFYRRGGQGIQVDDKLGATAASYFEIELINAAMQWKPAFFFVVEGYEPEVELQNIIRLLRKATRPSQWFQGSESAVEIQIRKLLAHMANGGPAGMPVRTLVDELSNARSFADVRTETKSTNLSLLHGMAPAIRADFSLRRVDEFLESFNQGSPSGPLPFPDRLSRLWLALRELAKLDAREIDRDIAARWMNLCDAWPSPAAWLRLHGPIRLGVLAGLHSQQELKNLGYYTDRDFPFGAYASEAYSIGKASQTLRWKARRFKAAVQLATRHSENHREDPSGALGIRASAFLQLAKLGRPWLVSEALADYREMLAIRQKRGATASAIGEAMAEYAFAQYELGRLLAWKKKEALARLREGVSLLDSDHPEQRAGFVIRAKKKLVQALNDAGFHDEANEQSAQAEHLAKRAGMP